MPHLTLEYSDHPATPIDWRTLLADLHTELMTLELFQLDELKSRAIGHSQILIGNGRAEARFVHLTVAILSGREPEAVREISHRCLELLRDRLAPIEAGQPLDITVEVREMERRSYAKWTSTPSR